MAPKFNVTNEELQSVTSKARNFCQHNERTDIGQKYRKWKKSAQSSAPPPPPPSTRKEMRNTNRGRHLVPHLLLQCPSFKVVTPCLLHVLDFLTLEISPHRIQKEPEKAANSFHSTSHPCFFQLTFAQLAMSVRSWCHVRCKTAHIHIHSDTHTHTHTHPEVSGRGTHKSAHKSARKVNAKGNGHTRKSPSSPTLHPHLHKWESKNSNHTHTCKNTPFAVPLSGLDPHGAWHDSPPPTKWISHGVNKTSTVNIHRHLSNKHIPPGVFLPLRPPLREQPPHPVPFDSLPLCDFSFPGLFAPGSHVVLAP